MYIHIELMLSLRCLGALDKKNDNAVK